MALKGLTAQDRADWEKRFAAQLEGRTPQEIDSAYVKYNFKHRYQDNEDYGTLATMSPSAMESYWNEDYDRKREQALSQVPLDSIDTFKQSADATRTFDPLHDIDKLPTDADQEEFRKNSAAYNQIYGELSSQYDGSSPSTTDYYGAMNIKKIAQEVSPYYRKYVGTEYLPFGDKEWADIAHHFQAQRQVYGDEQALYYLQKTIQDECSHNQSQLEKLWNGFQGMGADALASTISLTAGLVKGNWDYFTGNHEDIEGASGFTNYIDALIDNDVTRWANDVIQYGTLFPERRARAKELGISEIPVIQEYDEEHNQTGILNLMFNRNTVANLMNQYGFTLGSLAEGYGFGKMAQWGFKGAKGLTIARNMERTGKTAMELRNTLQGIRTAENVVNRYVIPGIVGTGEGMLEALQTKQDFLENGKQQVAEMQHQYVDNRFRALVEENYQQMFDEATKPKTFVMDKSDGWSGHFEGLGMSPEQAHEYVLQELYNQAWKEYDDMYQASVDQLEYDAARAGRTNFLLNSIINGGLNMSLQATLFNSNIQGQLRNTKLGRLASTEPRLNVNAQGKVSVDFPWYKRAWNYVKEPVGESIEEGTQYISDKYAQGKAGNNLANFMEHKYAGDDVRVGEIFANDYMAGLAAAGEALSDKELYVNMWYGLASSAMGGVHPSRRARRADGSKGGLFERGINAAGEQESNLEMIARIMPWRSGVAQGYQNVQAMSKQAANDAEILQAWIDNPDNRAKFDGLNGTYNWASDMQKSAESNDEFGYRNSAMGKSINDALMLQKMQGTEYYDAFMSQIQEVATLDANSEVAQQYVQKVRNAASTSEAFANMSDEEVIEQLKSNANKMLETMDRIQQHSEKIENTLGNIDIDTKEALIYGEMMIEDWTERAEQLAGEFKGIEIDNTTDGSSLSDVAKSFIARYGSIDKAFDARDKAQKTVADLTTDVHNLEKRKHLSKREQGVLAQKKAALARSKALLRTFKPLQDIDRSTQVLNEQEIMNLDPVTRANMLNPNNRSKFSEEQRAVIDHIIAIGNNAYVDFQDKIQDASRIQQATDAYIRDYSAVISDPQAFSMYAANAKREAAKAIYKKRYDTLRGVTDYNAFAQQMDKLLVDGNPVEKQTILAQFRRDQKEAEARGESTNFGRYIEQRQQIADIISHASKGETFGQLSGNDIDMFVHALTYLTEKGIDIRDNGAVVAALTEQDADGHNIFEKYVNEVNKDVEAAARTQFTSAEEVIQTLNSVLTEYDKDAANIAESYTPIEVTVEPEDASTPTAAPGIFATAATRIEDTDAYKTAEEGGEGTVTPETKVTETGQTVDATPTVCTELSKRTAPFEAGSSSEVLTAARNIEFLIENSKMTAAQKEAALNILQTLGEENNYESVEGFANDFKAALNKQDIAQANTDITQTLRKYVDKVVAKAMKDRADKQRREDEKTQNMQNAIAKSKLLQGALAFAQPDVRNSNNVQTLSIPFLKTFSSDPSSNNYSPLLSYIEKHGVEQFLQTHDLGRDVPMYFVFDPVLSQEQKQVYEEVSKRENKTIPYTVNNAALIAVIEHPEGTLTIDGKKYQPIGIMPRTGANNTYGSNRLDRVRAKLNESATSPYLVADSKGTIETRLSNHIYAHPMGQVYNNITPLQAGINDLTSDERKEFEALPVEQRKSSSIYQRIKKQFLDRLTVKRDGNGAGLYIRILNLYGKGGTTDVQVFVNELADTQGVDMSATIGELLAAGDMSVMSNSRFSRWSKALEKAIQSFDDFDVIIMPDGTIGEDAEKALNSFAEKLDKSLRNFLFAPQYSMKVVPGGVVDGKRQYTLTLSDGTTDIALGSFQAGTTTEEQRFEMLRNMIMDGNTVRQNERGKGLVKWQVNYKDFESSDSVARDNSSHIYDDGILGISKSGLNYNVEGVTLEAPYTMEGVRRVFSNPQVANADNASTDQKPVADQVAEVDGATIDAETGVIIDGTPKTENKPLEEAKRVAAQISSENVYSVVDNTFTQNGNVYQSTEPVSGNVEDVVRSSVKRVFKNILFGSSDTSHPNMSDKAYENYAATINAWKNKLIADGITLVNKELLATWTDGTNHFGQEVILGYDSNGQWHAYTVASDATKVSNEQLSMMCISLEKQFGISIRDYSTVAVRAEMPKGNEMRVEGEQVITNKSHVYDGARPSIVSTLTTSASDITSYTDVLSREVFSNTESTVIKPVVTPSDDFLGGFFEGLDPIDISAPTSYVSQSQAWGVFEGRGLNVEATTKAIEEQGITEEAWNRMTEAEREHELECKGVF